MPHAPEAGYANTRLNDYRDGWMARAALAAPQPNAAVADGWLDIATAPRDGTRVILAWGGQSINGYYLDNSHFSHPWQGWKVESLVLKPAGSPTAWQPFPAPPTLNASKEG